MIRWIARGYLITGSDRYLAPYRDAVDTVETRIRRIGSLTRHNVPSRTGWPILQDKSSSDRVRWTMPS
ncbi:MAG: CHASE3 domain-containing protein [Nitrospira sp.]|nr:CHASE3 domain-containing protein [Nitrospira sp.]